ncbi:hypothetical protein, partial [Frankia sp. AgB32]|uniref:hypothetical protein n=1 Tax=Frankia sp. AgB32 TaxID=631119 RepID=UPI00200CA297
MSTLLHAAAGPIAPAGDLHAAELHAAADLGLSPDQAGRLAANCADYTDRAGRHFERLVDLGAQVQALMLNPNIKDAEAPDAVASLMEQRAQELRALETFYLDFW